jgi:signal transduction histidine kinase/ActR/RegA family two-component response regulator
MWRPWTSVLRAIVEAMARFRLRTKFLLSFVVVTSGLMCATLFIVSRTAQSQVQHQIEVDSQNAILSFQVMQHQHQTALNHEADLLAALALMRNEDATAIRDASEDPWQSEDCNLFLLADARGNVVALHTTTGDFPAITAERLLRNSLKNRSTTGWWFSGEQLFQVVLRPVFAGEDMHSDRLGTVVVGRLMDANLVNDLHRISSTEVAFRYGGRIIVSTFPPVEQQALSEQAGSGAVPSELQIEGQKYLATAYDLTVGANDGISIIVLKSYDEAVAFLKQLDNLLIGLLLIAVLAGAALVFVISDRFTRPLAALAEGVRALEHGNFNYLLEARGGDEVAQVTRAFDGMRRTMQRNLAHRQQLEDQLRQASRMEAMGRLAGGIAHDFNNLLTVIKGHADLLFDRIRPTEALRGSAQQIAKAADRAANLTRQLLAFSRKQVLEPRVLDLNAMVTDTSKLLKRLVREDIEFVFLPGDSLSRIKADAGQIEQVIMNLTVNACDAMPEGGKLTIETYNLNADADFAIAHHPLRPGRYVALAVSDTGCGMDAETKTHIFEPFFTTKEQGKGTGLGLATVYGVVQQSNGYVYVVSEPGEGARFEVYLPEAEEPADSPMSEKAAAPRARRFETVLVAEDENAVRELVSESLSAAGYKVLTAKSGEEALEIVERNGRPIHLLLTDIILPKMRGTELASRAKQLRPDLKVVYMSGYLDYDAAASEFIEAGSFLQKPYTQQALVSKVATVLREAPAEPEIAPVHF